MRYFIDTNIFIFMLENKPNLTKNVMHLFENYENQIYVSSESIVDTW
jgi:PIN domain nuclease of toxin-antitoxin system